MKLVSFFFMLDDPEGNLAIVTPSLPSVARPMWI